MTEFTSQKLTSSQEEFSGENCNKKHNQKPLHETVYDCVTHYLESIGDQPVNNIYDFCLSQVEPQLIKAVMEHCNYNQTQTAQTLGINRGTLRKKCQQYNINTSAPK